MVNVVVKFGFAVIIFIVGLLFWISGDFANALSVSGWGRFFGGLIAMVVAVIVALIGGE